MMLALKKRLGFVVLGVLSISAVLAAVPYSGEDSDWGVARTVGVVDAYTGNVSFGVRDLSMAGAVGRYGLEWARVATSRDPGGAAFFGGGHHWRHNWQWELELTDGAAGEGIGSASVATVREPSGTAYQFTHDTSGDAGAWVAVSPAVRHTLRAEEAGGFVLQLLDGMRVYFALASESGGFVATEVCDPQSNAWTLSYDESGRLSQVTEPAGRTLSVNYAELASPDSGAVFRVISEVVSSNGQHVAYHYTFAADGDAPDAPVLSTVDYPDGTTASYAYAVPREGDPWLLTSADDPHAARSIRGRSFVYRQEPEATIGQLHELRTLNGEGLFYRLEAASENPEDRRYAITQENGAVRNETYNPGGNLAESINALGYTFKRDYDEGGRGQRTAETDELGAVTTFEHDANGHLSKTTFPDGSTQLQTWDAQGHLLSETDELGNTTLHTYDEKGRLTGLVYPDGSELLADYNAFAQLTSALHQDCGVVGFSYDEHGLLLEKTNELGGTAQYSYDAHDHLESITDERGNTTTYERDAAGRLAQVTYPDGASAHLEYDAFGKIVHVVDPTGVESRFVYDELGREVEAIGPQGEVVKTTYAPVGALAPADQPVKQESPLGRVVAWHYDEKGQLVERTDAATSPVATTTHKAYDAAGHVISETNPAEHTVLYGYDIRGRRTQITTALNHTTSAIYDAAGHKLTETDPAGNVTQWTYDSLGREITKTDANGETTTRDYDADGHLITLSDASGNRPRREPDRPPLPRRIPRKNDLRHTGPHTPLHQPYRSHALL